MNGGKCTSKPTDDGLFLCECPTGYKGKRCEIVPVIASTTPKPTTTSTKSPTTQSEEADTNDSEEDNSDDESGSVVDEEPEEIDNEA